MKLHTLKSILQLISAIPAAGVFADEYRSIVIAYLHLVLVGCISFFLIAWLIRRCVIGKEFLLTAVLILSGFTLSEIMLVMLPWNSSKFRMPVDIFNSVLFLFSAFMVVGIGRILYASIVTKR